MPRRLLQPGYRYITVGFLALAAGNVTGLYLSYRNDQRVDREIAQRCGEARANRAAIRAVLGQADPANLKPGDPGYAYYKAHPAELKAAEDAHNAALARFPEIPPARCEQ